MRKRGRPKGAKDSQKKAFSTKLNISLIRRIKARAKEESRSNNNLVELVLDANI